MPDGEGSVFDWGAAERAAPGQAESGDSFCVLPSPSSLLVAVVDGLGHGPEAVAATRTALEIIADHPEDPLPVLFRRCHEGLRKTRGAVLSLVRVDRRDRTLTWAGVGNVESRLFRAEGDPGTRSLVPAPGIVGHLLPSLRPETLELGAGDIVVLATDGVRSEFGLEAGVDGPSEGLAERILSRHGKDDDDALVVVVRYLGAGT